MARAKQTDDSVRERPAWLLPALVILAVCGFSALFLYHYFGPSTGELLGIDPRASAKTTQIEAVIGGEHFMIPENYTRYPSQRGGGVQPEIAMHALLPNFEPYSPALDDEFNDNTPQSHVIFFSLREAGATLSAERRLKEIYSRYMVSPKPETDPSGLQRFRLRPDSGYKDQDLLVGADSEGRLVLLLCERETALVNSPNCARTLLLTPNLTLDYRYKRSHLNKWREIDHTVIALAKTFEMQDLPDDQQ